MWHYIKGLLIGTLLLWFLLFMSFAISDGFIKAAVFSVTLTKAGISYFQKITSGTGILISLFVILSAWIWSFGKNKRPQPVVLSQDTSHDTPLNQQPMTKIELLDENNV